MKILNDLISALDVKASAREVRQGVFHTGVLTRNCGLASSLPRNALRQERPLVKEPGTLVQRSALQLAQMAHSESILEAAIGMAAINSLLYIDSDGCVELNARDLIASLSSPKSVKLQRRSGSLKKILGKTISLRRRLKTGSPKRILLESRVLRLQIIP